MTLKVTDYPFYTISFLKSFLKEYQVWFRKSFGQNFLVDKHIIEKIHDYFSSVRTAEGKSLPIIEIGGGSGNLSNILFRFADPYYIIEIDRFFQGLLYELYEKKEGFAKDSLEIPALGIPGDSGIKIIKSDVLKFDWEKFFLENNSRAFGTKGDSGNPDTDGKWIIAGNIPYNLSSPILHNLAGIKRNIDFIFLTVQKEYYERLNAFSRDSKDKPSYLSVFASYHFGVKKLFPIKNSSFYPQPKVESIALVLEPKTGFFNSDGGKEARFFKFVSFCFHQKRKKLLNMVYKHYNIPGEKTDFLLNEVIRSGVTGISTWPNSRPEELSVKNWIDLFEELENFHYNQKNQV